MSGEGEGAICERKPHDLAAAVCVVAIGMTFRRDWRNVGNAVGPLLVALYIRYYIHPMKRWCQCRPSRHRRSHCCGALQLSKAVFWQVIFNGGYRDRRTRERPRGKINRRAHHNRHREETAWVLVCMIHIMSVVNLPNACHLLESSFDRFDLTTGCLCSKKRGWTAVHRW